MKFLFIQNISSITKFPPYFSNYMLWSQKLKVWSKLNELNFFPHKCLLPDVILNESVKKLTRRKHFLWQKFIWIVWEMSVCRKNVSISRRRSFVLLSFYGESLVISALQVILHASVLWFHLKIFQPQRLKCSSDIFFLLGIFQTNSVVAAVEVNLVWSFIIFLQI